MVLTVGFIATSQCLCLEGISRPMCFQAPVAVYHQKVIAYWGAGGSAAMGEDLRELCAPRIRGARRVVIKAGTSVVSTPEGYPSLVRLANIVEQVSVSCRRGGH
jgi:hypothetical protein